MNAKQIRPTVFEIMRLRAPLSATVFWCLFSLSPQIQAQDIFMPPPEVSTTPPAAREYQTNQMQVFAPAEFSPGTQPPPVRWGPVTLRPHAFYRFLYGDGIASDGSNHVTTAVHYISPGLLFGIGRHWILDYTPTWTFYSSKQFRDSLDHSVRFAGATSYEDWFLGLSQSYVSSSAPLIQTGTQTDQETYSTTLNASYRFNPEMSLDLGGYQTFSSADQFDSYREWLTMDWFNYQFWPRLDASVGAGVGYVDVLTGTDMIYERILGRSRWRATDKISFEIRGGVETRQSLTNSGSNLLNPIAGAVIQYQPLDVTRLTLTVDRTVATSYLVNQVTETTDVVGGLNQRLFRVLHLDLSGGYTSVNYVSTAAGTSGRRDNTYSFNASLGWSFLKRGTASVFYRYSDNSSTLPGFSFTSNQEGFEVRYAF